MAEWFDPQLSVAIDLMRYSDRIVAFTGAGISTASGIPDFRSPGGLWEQFNPSTYANYKVFLKKPELYWDLERAMLPIFSKAKPNRGHKALVSLEKKGKLKAIITQNMDNFHQYAGSKIPIIEIHGNVNKIACMDCGSPIRRNLITRKLKAGERVPVCSKCGGRVKTNVILFNEPLGESVFEDARKAAENCDVFLVLGSSLSVYPANALPVFAKKAGAKLIFINMYPTAMDKYCTVRLLADLDTVLPSIISEV